MLSPSQQTTLRSTNEKSFFPDEREHIEILVSCRNLKLGSSFHDYLPYVALYIQRDGVYEYSAQTEKQTKAVNEPDFTKSFLIEYFFAVTQNLKFVIKACDRDKQEKILGEVEISVGRIIGSKDQTVMVDIANGNVKNTKQNAGQLLIRAERIAYTDSFCRMIVKVDRLTLPKKFIGKSTYDLSYRLLRPMADNKSYGVIYESEIRKSDSSRWSELEIKIQKLCNGDYSKLLKIQILNHTSKTNVSIVGEKYFTLSELIETKDDDYSASLIDPKTGNPSGKLTIFNFDFVEVPHFLEYIQTGLQFNLLLAIDFTSSNGDPKNPESLHAVSAEDANEYEKAIKAVFEILLNYNRDKKVRMFGFGGIPILSGELDSPSAPLINHCFPVLSEVNKNIYSVGLEGVISSYRKSLNKVQLASPSYLEPIISQAKRIAKTVQDRVANEYVILLILTDGRCHDMQDTINALINGTNLPLSVIIVGLGDGDFKKMEILDGDKGLMNHQGVKADRDLVQFVPFRKFQKNPDLLAKHVLEEVPDQVMQYMLENKIFPKALANLRLEEENPEEEESQRSCEVSISEVEEDKYTYQKNQSLMTFCNSQVKLASSVVDANQLRAGSMYNSQMKLGSAFNSQMRIDSAYFKPFEFKKEETVLDTLEDDEDLIDEKNLSLSRFQSHVSNRGSTFFKALDMMKKDQTTGSFLSQSKANSPGRGPTFGFDFTPKAD